MLVKKTGKFDIYEVTVLCEDKTTKFKVKGGTEVKVLRKKFLDKEGSGRKHVTLIFDGVALDDEMKLRESGIVNGCQIEAHFNYKGGNN